MIQTYHKISLHEVVKLFGNYLRAKQVDEPAETELVHVIDGRQVVAGEVQLHCKFCQILETTRGRF